MTFQPWTNSHYGRSASPAHVESFLEIIQYWQKFLRIAENFSALTLLKKSMSGNIYPQFNKLSLCTLMFVVNLAYPEWVTIECGSNHTILDIVCMRKNKTSPPKPNDAAMNCEIGDIVHNSSCLMFEFYNGRTDPHAFHRHKFVARPAQLVQAEEIKFLLLSVGSNFPAILTLENTKVITHTVGERVQSVVHFRTFFEAQEKANGYFVSPGMFVDNRSHPTGNTFACRSGMFVSTIYLCDRTVHCGEGDFSDEEHCICDESANNFSRCKFFCEKGKHCKCTSLYYSGADGQCCSFSQKIEHMKSRPDMTAQLQQNKQFTCQNGSFLKTLLVDDFVPDCGDSAEDEDILKDVGLSFQITNNINATHLAKYNAEMVFSGALEQVTFVFIN